MASFNLLNNKYSNPFFTINNLIIKTLYKIRIKNITEFMTIQELELFCKTCMYFKLLLP
jgi:hypothetical protein